MKKFRELLKQASTKKGLLLAVAPWLPWAAGAAGVIEAVHMTTEMIYAASATSTIAATEVVRDENKGK